MGMKVVTGSTKPCTTICRK